MTDYPYLSLSSVSIDPTRRLAYYYLALPLARDDDQLTVVMAHPGNQTAVAMLQAVLGGRIVPVQGAASEIKATLNLIWSEETEPAAPRILCWGASPERSVLVMSVANLVAHALSAQTICLDASQNSLETVLTIAREGQYSLTVIDAPQGEMLSHFLRESSTPVLLVRGEHLNLQHILLVLRGHSPDESVLDWVIPLAQAHQAQVTLLTVAPAAAGRYRRGPRRPHGLASLLSPDSGPGEHITTCAQRLTEAGAQGYLKLRQGVPRQQIAVEVAQGNYDLITIAAEAHGNFVRRVLDQIGSQAPSNKQPVLVVKPIAESMASGARP
jgi:nucleotide-binding universal stress UspA family protein